MTRRKGHQALREIERAKDARWRYAIRNPTFREEIRELSRLFEAKDKTSEKRFQVFKAKWRFERIDPKIVRGLIYAQIRTDEELTLYLDAHRWRILSVPVFPIGEPTENTPWVTFIVDTSQPRDLLLAWFEGALEIVMPKRAARRRSDKADFYLGVYDRAKEGQTFAAIAKSLKRKLSTVKSAYLSAGRSIFGVAGVPTKKEVPLVGFDQKQHMQSCSTCKAAEKYEDLCPAAQAYATQD